MTAMKVCNGDVETCSMAIRAAGTNAQEQRAWNWTFDFANKEFGRSPTLSDSPVPWIVDGVMGLREGNAQLTRDLGEAKRKLEEAESLRVAQIAAMNELSALTERIQDAHRAELDTARATIEEQRREMELMLEAGQIMLGTLRYAKDHVPLTMCMNGISVGRFAFEHSITATELIRARAERNAALASAPKQSEPTGTADDEIPRPTVIAMREHLSAQTHDEFIAEHLAKATHGSPNAADTGHSPSIGEERQN